jgi:DNA-binding response OmpR family regulator
MKRPRILVIENDEAAAGRVVSFLEEAGYDVVKAADAALGMAMLYETRPDLVVMAGSLPVINGEDPCLRVRQASYLPIIVLGGIYDAVEALELGADAYMNKPPSREELVARVHALLRRRPTDCGTSVSGPDYDFFHGHAS